MYILAHRSFFPALCMYCWGRDHNHRTVCMHINVCLCVIQVCVDLHQINTNHALYVEKIQIRNPDEE